MRGLSGKRALITGGSRGIGLAIAERFISEGCFVAVAARDPDRINRLHLDRPDLKACLVADISNQNDVQSVFQHLDTLWGGIDILINNAGIDSRRPFLEVSQEEWQNIIATNLTGAFLCAQEASKRFINSGGVIINIASTNGLVGYHNHAPYNASKAGLIELTRSMALELAPQVRVNAICPGYIMTEMQEQEYTHEQAARFAAKLPLGRLGNPEEVAALCAFLASDEAAFITGQTLVIDGGELAGGLASSPD